MVVVHDVVNLDQENAAEFHVTKSNTGCKCKVDVIKEFQKLQICQKNVEDESRIKLDHRNAMVLLLIK